jgi:serine/threonine protein kinase
LQVAAIFKIGNSKEIPEIPEHLSAEGKHFLNLCLQREPAARPTAAQLLEHPFVRDQVAGNRVIKLNRDSTPSSSSQTAMEFPSRSISPLPHRELRVRTSAVFPPFRNSKYDCSFVNLIKVYINVFTESYLFCFYDPQNFNIFGETCKFLFSMIFESLSAYLQG